MFMTFVIMIICVLVGVAFLTLLERKVLGYIQFRKGPNKVGFNGILQPFGDAIKLFTKEQMFPFKSNYIYFYLSPMFGFFLALLLWNCMPFFSFYFNFSYSLLFFLCVSSLGVYGIMLSGWSSNSGYALLGSVRSIAQTISYEVSLVVILMSFLFMVYSFNFFDFVKFQENVWFIFMVLPLSFMWLVICLAETNRSPFDFSEGESELVSGFNVEYSSGSFALIFLAEYSNILFMSMVSVILFLGSLFNFYFFGLKIMIFSFFWIWVRGTLPRYRYDKLMNLAWKIYLPFSLNFFIFMYSLSMINLVFFDFF
uniref:NADH-ubiquinone oxidoreductase chain 1 n=1 Tax=Platypus contaminatus TaxID=2066526 RepID=A0A6C0RVC0_9CUCU|nr:NADH dehydrogenase subunit 1 [Platypus contaminatus]QIA44540.1 NADH dehydrogenase subunit 1 [Platypus contaminatus]